MKFPAPGLNLKIDPDPFLNVRILTGICFPMAGPVSVLKCLDPFAANVRMRYKMSGSVVKCPDPFLNVRICSQMSGSIPKYPDPFLNVRILYKMS
jgi:hypothetical protein